MTDSFKNDRDPSNCNDDVVSIRASQPPFGVNVPTSSRCGLSLSLGLRDSVVATKSGLLHVAKAIFTGNSEKLVGCQPVSEPVAA